MNVMINSKPLSISQTTNAIRMEAIKTTTALLVKSLLDGQDTLWTSSVYDSLILLTIFIFYVMICTGGETRTPDTWFWRPVLYQLSYTRILTVNKLTSKQVNG